MPRASTQPFVQATILSILSTLTMLSMLAAPSTATAQEAWHAVQEQHAMDLLRSLPTARAGYRTPQEIAGLQKTEELVLEHLRTLGYQPQTQDVPRPERIATLTPEEAPTPRNIWVDLPGEGDRAGELLVMMAHIDSVVGSPGADDNATGVVALLEMARLLKDRPRQRTVRILFTNLEEIGLHGAKAHATRTIQPEVDAGNTTVVGAVSIEMIGYYSDEPGSQQSPLPPSMDAEQSDRGDFLALVGVKRHQEFTQALAQAMRQAEPEAKLLVLDTFVVPPPDIMRSDHAPFIIRGWPGAMLTDTANFRNPHYHQPTDTVETIDAPRFARAISQIIAATDALANPDAPANQDDPQREDGAATP